MHEFTFEPTYHARYVVLVGLGGTGSQVARSLARIVYDMGQRGLHVPQILFVDPDVVEDKNVGRQMFTPADVGQSKAELLARRFNRTLGLGIEWDAEPFDPDRHTGHYNTLLIGAVDNHEARRAMADADCLWLDAGNSYQSGQVVVGNTMDPDRVRYVLDRLTEKGSTVSTLPSPGLVFPDLLEPEPDRLLEEVELSCAERVVLGSQHLLVNDLMAATVAQYTWLLLHRQPLMSALTYLDSETLTMRSELLTKESVLLRIENPT